MSVYYACPAIFQELEVMMIAQTSDLIFLISTNESCSLSGQTQLVLLTNYYRQYFQINIYFKNWCFIASMKENLT